MLGVGAKAKRHEACWNHPRGTLKLKLEIDTKKVLTTHEARDKVENWTNLFTEIIHGVVRRRSRQPAVESWIQSLLLRHSLPFNLISCSRIKRDRSAAGESTYKYGLPQFFPCGTLYSSPPTLIILQWIFLVYHSVVSI